MNIEITKKANRQILKIDNRYQSRMIRAIEALPIGDVAKLTSTENHYRLRVGFLRVLFTMQDDCIVIYKIEKRGNVYK